MIEGLVCKMTLGGAAVVGLVLAAGCGNASVSQDPPERLGTSLNALSTAGVTYGGGPLLNPEIVPVYWGTFTSDQRAAKQAYLQSLASYMSGGKSPQGQQPTIAQYGVRGAWLRSGTPAQDTALPRSCDAGPPCTTQSGINQQVAFYQSLPSSDARWVPPYSQNRLIVVFVAGIDVTDLNACARHGGPGTGQYLAIVPLNACGDDQTATSHEILEAASDPENSNSGWHGSVNEIADACESGSPNYTVVSGVGHVANVLDQVANGACTVWTNEQLAQVNAATQSGNGQIQIDLFGLAGDGSVSTREWNSQGGWQAWGTLGGQVMGPPVVVAGAGGFSTLDVFARGIDWNVYHRQWNGTQWSPATTWQSIGGPSLGQPAVVAWSSGGVNRIDVYVQGIDGAYWHQANTGSGFSGSWDSVGGNFNGAPTVAWRGSGSPIDLFGRGIDGTYWHKNFNGSTYSPSGASSWDKPFGTGVYISEPVVAASLHTLDVFGQGTDWNYYTKEWTDTSGWQTTFHINPGAIFNGPPVATWQSATALDLFGQGTDTAYWHIQRLNGTWGGAFESLGAPGFGAPTAIVPVSADLNLFVQASDHSAYERVLQGAAWGAWSSSLGNGLLH